MASCLAVQVCNLSWSKNVNEIVSTHGYSQNQVIVWKQPTMTKLATLTGHTMRVLYLAVSPDGQTIVTGAGALHLPAIPLSACVNIGVFAAENKYCSEYCLHGKLAASHSIIDQIMGSECCFTGSNALLRYCSTAKPYTRAMQATRRCASGMYFRVPRAREAPSTIPL